MTTEQRRKLLNDIAQLICAQYEPGLTLFGVAIEKELARQKGQDPVLLAFEEICNRFNIFLTNISAAIEEQRGLVIMDRSREEQRLQPLVQNWCVSGTKFGRLHHIAEVPFFADSTATRMIQFADFTAYAIFRRYESTDTSLFDQIADRFHTDEKTGRIHGLVHYTRDYRRCSCPACLSRRVAGQADQLDLSSAD